MPLSSLRSSLFSRGKMRALCNSWIFVGALLLPALILIAAAIGYSANQLHLEGDKPLQTVFVTAGTLQAKMNGGRKFCVGVCEQDVNRCRISCGFLSRDDMRMCSSECRYVAEKCSRSCE